jgi:hypothetical protein
MDNEDPFGNFRNNINSEEETEENDDNILKRFKQITISVIHPEGKWCLPPLYKPGANGQLFHQIGFDGVNVISVHGLSGMKLQTSPTEVVMNTKSVSLQHQAMIQARGLFRSKYDDNYRELGSNLPRVKEPMLGYPISEAETCMVPLLFPVAVEVKLDGVRCMFELTDGVVTARSRGGKYYTQYDHICKFLFDVFAYFPHDTMLDAEMYNHGMKREQISSITRTIAEEMEEGKLMTAYIFDAKFPQDLDYESRKKMISETVNLFLEDKGLTIDQTPISLVPYELVYSKEQMLKFDDWATSQGYEGTMVKRTMSSVLQNDYGKQRQTAIEYTKYKEGRSHRCYKIKGEQDEEGIIIDVTDCRGREKGCAKFTIVDPRGNIFSVRPTGKFELRREMLQNRLSLIGKLYTYKMTGLTAYGVPDHPRGIGIRDDLDTEKVISEMKKNYANKGICLCSQFGENSCICGQLRIPSVGIKQQKKKYFKIKDE